MDHGTKAAPLCLGRFSTLLDPFSTLARPPAPPLARAAACATARKLAPRPALAPSARRPAAPATVRACSLAPAYRCRPWPRGLAASPPRVDGAPPPAGGSPAPSTSSPAASPSSPQHAALRWPREYREQRSNHQVLRFARISRLSLDSSPPKSILLFPNPPKSIPKRNECGRAAYLLDRPQHCIRERGIDLCQCQLHTCFGSDFDLSIKMR
jgi:hypothetical protein